VPSRGASSDELIALAGALRGTSATALEFIVPGCLNGFTVDELDLLADMSAAAGRPLNWNVLGVSSFNPSGHEAQLAAADHARGRGGRVVALTLPHSMRIRLSFLTGTVLDGLPGWAPVLALPVPERLAALSDPEVRRSMRDGAASDEAGILRALADWGRLEVVETFAAANAGYEGRRVGDIAAEVGGDPFDVLLDVVVADGLRTGLRPGGMRESAADWELRAAVWRDPRAVIGGSDAGAHLDMMCGAVYSTALLGRGVREYGVVSLEEAVRLLTSVPAELYGLDRRGRIADGWAADAVVFDLDRVADGPERTCDDLPGGASRLVADSVGVERVLVGGVGVVEEGRLVGATPGTLLRSGRDAGVV
jgi:N-acyl-D-aspartate/D-glutamate deacylase